MPLQPRLVHHRRLDGARILAPATWFWIDPTNDLIFIGMTQRMVGNGRPPTAFRSRGPVYGALVDPQK